MPAASRWFSRSWSDRCSSYGRSGSPARFHIYYTPRRRHAVFLRGENWRLFLTLFGLYVLRSCSRSILAPVAGLVAPEDQAFRDMLSGQAMINTAAIIAALIFYALWDRDRARMELQDESMHAPRPCLGRSCRRRSRRV